MSSLARSLRVCSPVLTLPSQLSRRRRAVREVSGLARTARGPVMSTSPGKIVIDGVAHLDRGPAFVLRFLQARDPELVGRPFFATQDPHAQWWDQLRPYGPNDRKFFGSNPRTTRDL